MIISFTQLYSEVGASFDRLDGPLLHTISSRLNELDKEIEQFAIKLKYKNFKLLFTLSASSSISEIEVKGPTFWQREHKVGFTLFLPWRITRDFVEEVDYVLPLLAQGIASVLVRYGAEVNGLNEIIEQVIREVKKEPRKFRYPNRVNDV